MNKELTKISKFLSFILRHKPEAIGISLDENGWAYIDEILDKSSEENISKENILLAVETNDKQRFSIDASGQKIRANQGHSIVVDLELAENEPPEILFHGTASRFLPSIREQGLIKQQRQHVHLSQFKEVAQSVGTRYGKPVIFKIPAKKMYAEGYKFYKSANNVWLVNAVPANYLTET
ncbi:RNA 2'-phosphotransferase [Endozoicomonas sp. OPT23]|uniref:RNA 2'-phosphotransferase n=1 Tax=Endozoicomonas sp. OPT23 TaxID=2072845 RepID=UPI00129B88AE|nr:RNA 2'-phosphotransferase [Endozoicomonas sp. OPT23]MRI35161.1 RNA 2'-phosphotransferase [Endozoicomonas sp. OPT23]